MNPKSASRIICKLLALGLALSPIGSLAKVGEQENWYLAKEWSARDVGRGVDYRKDPGTGKELVYVCTGNQVTVYDMDGTPDSNVTGMYFPLDVAVDANGACYVAERNRVSAYDPNGILLWRTGKNASSGNGLLGSGDGEFHFPKGITIGPSGDLFVADEANHRIQVLDRETGAFKRKFGAQGNAPGQFQNANDLAFLPDGRLVVGGGSYLNFFKATGAFLSRKKVNDFSYLSVRRDGKILSGYFLRDGEGENIVRLNFISLQRTVWTPNGDIVESYGSKIRIWKRAYRTKGLPAPNVIPQPVVRAVAQRPGTNILDIDFEILDSDDATATAGIIAAVDGKFDDLKKLIAPTAWTDGTESKIGTPIATNQVHRVSWYVKGDWTEQTGNLKFGVLCKDARRAKPVDLHFLELPISGGKLTISRSPLKDSDISNFLLFELGTGLTSLSIQYGKIKDANGNTLAEQSGTSIISTQAGRDYFMNALGYRWATIGEVAMAREATTPGTINEFTASNQVKPRNLPGKVNEYGFDVGDHGNRAWWVVKANEVNMPTFTYSSLNQVIKNSISSSNSAGTNLLFGRDVSIFGNQIIACPGGSVSPLHFVLSSSIISFPITTKSGFPAGLGAARSIDKGEISRPVSYDSDLLAVGSSQEGAVYIYTLPKQNNGSYRASDTTQVARITPDGSETGEGFGATVALFNKILIVGAPWNNANGFYNAGCAYVFKINDDFSWSQIAKVSNPQGEASDQFGLAIAAGQNIFAIGANDYQPLDHNGDHGVFIYKVEGNKVNQVQLIPGGRDSGLNHFGNSLAIEGDLLFVGSHIGGAVSIYKIANDGTASPLNIIWGPKFTMGGGFGTSIAVHDDILVIGSPDEASESSISDGVVYVYKIWPDGRATLLDRLRHPESQQLMRFGESVSINESQVLVGAPGYDKSEDEPNFGSVVLFNYSK